MENIAVTRLMKIINTLSFELKLEVLSKLTEDLKANFQSKDSSKEKLLNELFGSWSDVEDSVLEDIIKDRTISNKEVNLD